MNEAKKEYDRFNDVNIVDNISCSAEPFYETITLKEEEDTYFNNVINKNINQFLNSPENNKIPNIVNFASKISNGKGNLIDLYHLKIMQLFL
jgi:hypothetical protein